MARGWTDEDITDEIQQQWANLTLPQLRQIEYIAEENIAELLQQLYLRTGEHFKIEVQLFRADELNGKTQWVARSHYRVRVSTVI